jgi:pilus assembly protein TadC
MRATLIYTGLRLGVLAVALIGLYFAGARGALLLALGLVISGIASYLLLSRHRDAMSVSISNRMSRISAGLEAGARAEDDDGPAAG